jgi:hypothetical protein
MSYNVQVQSASSITRLASIGQNASQVGPQSKIPNLAAGLYVQGSSAGTSGLLPSRLRVKKPDGTWATVWQQVGPQGIQGVQGLIGLTGPVGPPGISTWGAIGGVLSSQADLAAALAAKSDGTGTSAPTTTGTQTALAIPTGTGDLVIFANNATLLNVQGIAAGLHGQKLTIVSIGAGQVDFNHQHASATAANRLVNFATVGITSLAAGSGVATFIYSTTDNRWHLDAHEQGAWITPAYNAGDFIGIGGMTWTVDAGDITTFAFVLNGRSLTVSYWLDTTTISAPLAALIAIHLPNGYVAGRSVILQTSIVNDNGSADIVAESQSAATSAYIFLAKVDGTVFLASVNNTNVRGTITFEVQ